MKQLKRVMIGIPDQLKIYLMMSLLSGSVLFLIGAGYGSLNVTVDPMNEDAVVQMIAIGSAGIYKFSSMVNCGGADVTTNAMTSFQWVGGGTASTKHIVTTSAGKQKETVDVKHIYTVGTQTYTNTGTGSNEVYVIAMASVSGPQVVVVGQENTYTGYSTGGVSQSDFPSGWPRWENNGSAASSGVMSFETAGSQTVKGI